jgi:hypothetical protein
MQIFNPIADCAGFPVFGERRIQWSGFTGTGTILNRYPGGI